MFSTVMTISVAWIEEQTLEGHLGVILMCGFEKDKEKGITVEAKGLMFSVCFN